MKKKFVFITSTVLCLLLCSCGNNPTPSPKDNEPTLSSIVVATAPTKVTYQVNEYFDPAGLAITATYSD